MFSDEWIRKCDAFFFTEEYYLAVKNEIFM